MSDGMHDWHEAIRGRTDGLTGVWVAGVLCLVPKFAVELTAVLGRAAIGTADA